MTGVLLKAQRLLDASFGKHLGDWRGRFNVRDQRKHVRIPASETLGQEF